MFKKILLGIFALLGLVLSFGSEGAYDSAFSLGGEVRPSVTISHTSWDDGISGTAVIANVLRDEGFDVELVQLDPAILFSSVATGDSDFSVSPWLPVTHGAYMEEYGNRIDHIGTHTPGAVTGLVVPEYMEDLNSIEDLSDEAGQVITGIEPGAGISSQTDIAIETYPNLSDWDHQQSSTGAMLTSLRQAYNNQEEIVIAGWTPHWKFIDYDLKILEDPQNVYGDGENLDTIARVGLENDNPIAYQIIENFSWEIEDMQQVMLYLNEDMSPTDAARMWMDENPEKVAEWTEGIDVEE